MTKLKMTVSEPWDFDAGDGTPTFYAYVDPALSGERQAGRTEKDYWFVVHCEELVAFETMRFTSLLLTPRHYGIGPPLERLLKGEKVYFNAMWRMDGKPWGHEDFKAVIDGQIKARGIVLTAEKAD